MSLDFAGPDTLGLVLAHLSVRDVAATVVALGNAHGTAARPTVVADLARRAWPSEWQSKPWPPLWRLAAYLSSEGARRTVSVLVKWGTGAVVPKFQALETIEIKVTPKSKVRPLVLIELARALAKAVPKLAEVWCVVLRACLGIVRRVDRAPRVGCRSSILIFSGRCWAYNVLGVFSFTPHAPRVAAASAAARLECRRSSTLENANHCTH